MLVYKPCEGPELEMVIKRVTRYPTLEPWGGVVSPGSGTRYHTDVVTTGTNGYVVSTHENVLRHS